jgi:hypothetical protein
LRKLNNRITFQEVPPLVLNRAQHSSRIIRTNTNIACESIQIGIADELINACSEIEDEQNFNI